MLLIQRILFADRSSDICRPSGWEPESFRVTVETERKIGDNYITMKIEKGDNKKSIVLKVMTGGGGVHARVRIRVHQMLWSASKAPGESVEEYCDFYA